jgi:anti-anti-sigma factor
VNAAWIYLAGELDLPAVLALKETLWGAQSASFMVLVDLRDLEFIDCAALGALVEAEARARSTRKSLVLLRGSGQVDRMLKLTGLLEELEVVDLAIPDSTPPCIE